MSWLFTIQQEYEDFLRRYLNPKFGYTSAEIAYMAGIDRFDTIVMAWRAKRHGVLKERIIQVKNKGVVHWLVVPPKTRKLG